MRERECWAAMSACELDGEPGESEPSDSLTKRMDEAQMLGGRTSHSRCFTRGYIVTTLCRTLGVSGVLEASVHVVIEIQVVGT